MAEWFENPVYLVAVLGVVGLVFATGQWVCQVNSHVRVVSALLKEIRFSIKEIQGRLAPAPTAGDCPPNPEWDQNTQHQTADDVRAKLAELRLSGADISDAVAWARSDQ